MRLCFIGSGIEREDTRLQGIEIQAVVGALRPHYDQLVFGGSSIGLMEAFASAFLTSGGSVTSVIPGWLEGEGLAFHGGDSIRCDDLAERKHLMFDGIDGVICYPGGIGTYDELFDLLASRATEGPGNSCPPIYLYNWEKFYAPLLLQLETALEVGLIHSEKIEALLPFESIEGLSEILERQAQGR